MNTDYAATSLSQIQIDLYLIYNIGLSHEFVADLRIDINFGAIF